MASQLILGLIVAAVLGQLAASSFEDTPKQLERVINGFDAKPKQLPHQVLLYLFENFKWRKNCGGTIISKRVVLSAAHCFTSDYSAVKIYFGTVNQTNIDEKGQQRLIVDRKHVVVHQGYERLDIINDIALIKLPAELQFDDYIKAARLPDVNKDYADEVGVVSGWGAVKDNGTRLGTDILKYADVPIISNKNCTDLQWRYNRFFRSASKICIGPSPRYVCFGDSGGPLALRNADGSVTVLGIASYVMDMSCTVQRPAVYTRVSSFLDWIKQNAGNGNLQ